MKEKQDENEMIEDNKNKIMNGDKKENQEKVKLIKVNSTKLVIKSDEEKDDSFEIISKNKEFEDDFGFTETGMIVVNK